MEDAGSGGLLPPGLLPPGLLPPGLLEAVVAIGSGLDLEATLRRIVQAAVDLVDARYGALGVIGDEPRLVGGRVLVGQPPRQTGSGQVQAGTDQTISLGQVSLTPGNYDLQVAGAKINGDELFRLRSIELKPVSVR